MNKLLLSLTVLTLITTACSKKKGEGEQPNGNYSQYSDGRCKESFINDYNAVSKAQKAEDKLAACNKLKRDHGTTVCQAEKINQNNTPARNYMNINQPVSASANDLKAVCENVEKLVNSQKSGAPTVTLNSTIGTKTYCMDEYLEKYNSIANGSGEYYKKYEKFLINKNTQSFNDMEESLNKLVSACEDLLKNHLDISCEAADSVTGRTKVLSSQDFTNVCNYASRIKNEIKGPKI